MNISQRQATIVVLGFQLTAIIILWLNQILASGITDPLTLGASLALIIYGGMLFAYLRGWEYARHMSVIFITLIVAAFLPEPFVTTYAPFLILLGPILALVLVNPLWVIGSAAATIGLLLLRAGGVGIYVSPTTLLLYAMLIIGLVVSRVITETARLRVEKTEEALNDSQARMASIINSAMDAIISIDDAHRIVLFNPAAEKMFGYTAEEIMGQSLDTLIPELYRPNHPKQISIFAQTGITKRQMNGYTEITGVKKNGDEIPIDTSISQVQTKEGKLFTAILRDVTEHKQAGETLRKMHNELELQFQQRTTALSEANVLLETLLEYVPDQIYFKDTESRFIKNSRSQARALGLSDPSLAVGKTDFDFFPHAQRSFDEEQEIMRSGKPLVDFEERVVWPDGKETWVSTSKVPLRNQDGKIAGTFGISRDITERKRAEESLRKAKDELEIRVAERTAELIEANKQLQQAQNIAGLGNYFIDLTTGEWKGSEIFDNLLGIDETFERTMETWTLLIHPNDRQRMVDYFTNEVIVKHARFDKEYRIIRQDDQAERWVHTLGELEVDSQNQPLKMVGTVQDITERKQIKAQIEYQAHLLKQINDAIVATDDQFHITVWNHGAEKLYGWSAAEALGRSSTEVIHSEMTTTERNEILRQLRESGEYHLELLQYRKDGQPVYVEASTVTIYNENKQPTGLLSVNRDITERKQAEEKLRESESNARSLVSLSKRLEQAQTYSEALSSALDKVKIVLGYQNVWTYLLSEDKQQLQLLTITGEKSQVVTDGFPTLTIKGDRFLEEISEGMDIVLVEDARTDPRTNKEIVAQLGNRTIVNAPIMLMDRHLGIFGTGTFGDEGVHIPTSTQLDYLRALASHLAVTLDRIHLLNKRKQVEAELYKSEELLRLGYDTAKLGIWQNNLVTGMVHFDERARAQYGFDADNVSLADVIARVHPDDVDRLGQEIATTTDPASDGRYGTEYRVIHADGSVHWLAVQARVYFQGEDNSRRPVTGFGTSQDITERKKAEEEIRRLNENLEERIEERTTQLEAANKELEAFSYSVSHDLRSPLRGIDGWSLALLEDYGGLLDEQGQAHIQRVRAETQRMGELIDDILKLSRITRAEMNKEEVDLSAIAETIVTRLQETRPKDRQVEFIIQKGLTAMGDPKLLDVVLTNLLGNAFKFTNKKQEAHIEFGKTIIEGEHAYFVRDNGAGFDMTYANKLFGAFQRMHRISEFPGTGIGLATVQRVIHRHGGSIWASSEMGAGATFYFTLEDNDVNRPEGLIRAI